ncbi:MAG: OmpA family protein [Psychrobacter sp.]|uniref:OmpA family protein n=1 Tax=unclassified Psychrobacter TaxID=196806 RepID=UPI0017883090|nr:OmpA family protein [Psychrobacter sp. FME5]MBE0444786.1 OmpA family protein [Psychrobacter sp. FME5]MDN5801598.1 OmpA family protein [Psychrobacter sp.]MDN5891545.1 OmpA family protein [Psychrobacter sp.]
MNVKLWTIASIMISALALTGCQTADLSKQKSKTINMPTVMVSLDSDGDGVPDELDQCPNTKMKGNVVVDDRGCHLIMGPDMSLKMEYRAFFAKGSSELTSKYQVELDKVAARMKEYDTAIFKIEAHISEDENNKELSSLPKNRALIIKNYLLLKHGIESSRLMTLNCEARAPIAPNDTDEGRSFNRRVYGLLTEPDNEYPINLKDGICVKF